MRYLALSIIVLLASCTAGQQSLPADDTSSQDPFQKDSLASRSVGTVDLQAMLAQAPSPSDSLFLENVPVQLLNYMKQHDQQLQPDLRLAWQQNGLKTVGNWEHVFGSQAKAIFQVWCKASWLAAEVKRQGITPAPTFPTDSIWLDIWRAAAPDFGI